MDMAISILRPTTALGAICKGITHEALATTPPAKHKHRLSEAPLSIATVATLPSEMQDCHFAKSYHCPSSLGTRPPTLPRTTLSECVLTFPYF